MTFYTQLLSLEARSGVRRGVDMITALILGLLFSAGSCLAQDNSQGRYRPEGRLAGLAAGREFNERPYEVRTYEPVATPDAFDNAMVFYPLTLSFDPPNGAEAFMPGYRASAAAYEWWGPTLASLGYSVFILETNSPTDSLAARTDALKATVEFIKAENRNMESPVANKIDPEKIALIGHSMGGSAALRAALELGDTIKAVIPLALYCCEPGESFSGDYSNISASALVIASSADEVAVPAEHARLVYESIGSSKIYIEFADGDHAFVSNSGVEKATLGRFVLAFLKATLDDRLNLGDVLSNPSEEYMEKFSHYETAL